MSKDKKSKQDHDIFLSMLNEELSSRKIFDKAKKSDDEFFLSEFEEDLIAEPIEVPEPKKIQPKPTKKSPKAKKSSPPKTKKIAAEKKSPPAKKIPKPVPPEENLSLAQTLKKIEKDISSTRNLQANSDFEKRVFAEADNDFYDEKSPENIGDNMRSISPEEKPSKPIFRSKYFDESESADEKNSPEDAPEAKRKLTHAEAAGIAISSVMLIYSFATLDKPLFFLAMSLLSHLLRPLIGPLCGKYNRPVQNAMRSFSLVLFFGAILFIFT